MSRVKKIYGTHEHVTFKCPGCGSNHTLPVTGPNVWVWNGSFDRPTLTPSILSTGGHFRDGWKQGDGCWCDGDYGFRCHRCHSFVEDGRIRFLSDCSHALAGQTVDLPDLG